MAITKKTVKGSTATKAKRAAKPKTAVKAVKAKAVKPAAKAKAAASQTKAAKPVKAPTYSAPASKSQIIADLSTRTSLTKQQVKSVLDELGIMIEGHIKPRACGEFKLPGLMTIKKEIVPAKKARKNVPNPFKPGEFMDVKAKPATTRVKVRPLVGLKKMAAAAVKSK